MTVLPQLRRIAEVNPATPEFLKEQGEITFVPLECVWSGGRADFSRRAEMGQVETGYTRFRQGDVLLPKVTPTFQAGRTAVATIDTPVGAASTEVHVIRPTQRSDADYLAYLTQSDHFLGEGLTTVQGVGNLLRVPADYVKEFRSPVTDVHEQRAIADFLDRETGQIDTMIEAQRELVNLLDERRVALRREIALGAEGTSLMETDLPWAPRVPGNWKVVPLRTVAHLESGHTPSRSRPELWEDCYIPWISLNDVANMASTEYLRSTVNLISEKGIAASSARLLPPQTVVLSRDATIGRTSIMEVPMATSQHFGAWVCGPELSSRYLWLLFDSAMQPLFDSLTNGSTLRTIGMPELRAFKIPLPDITEQEQIVERASRATAQIDAMIDAANESIALMQERRAALISAAVTGRIDPRTGHEYPLEDQ